MEAITFCNFTNEDFTWKFDGIPYTFKAGQTIFLEDFKAYHFAKHLIDREMNRMGILTNDDEQRKILGNKCIVPSEPVTPLEALQINEEVKVTKTKKVAEEFADLEELPAKKAKHGNK